MWEEAAGIVQELCRNCTGIVQSNSFGCLFQMLLISCHSIGKVLLKLSRSLCWILQLLFLLLSGFSLVIIQAIEKWVEILLIKFLLPWNIILVP